MKRQPGIWWINWIKPIGVPGGLGIPDMNKMLKAFIIAVLMVLTGYFGTGLRAQEDHDSVKVEGNKRLEYRFDFAEALRHKMLGDLKTARQYLERCLDAYPDSAAPAYEMASIMFVGGEFTSAVIYAEKAWNKYPDNPWYGQMYAECLVKLEKYNEAANIYDKVWQLKPEVEEYFLVQVDLLMKAGAWKDALKKVRQLKDDPEHARWSVLKSAEIYSSMKDEKKSRKVIESYLESNRNDIEARGILAESYAAAGKLKEANFHYSILRDIDPDNPAVRFSYAQFLYTNNQKDKALLEYIEGFKSGDVNPMIKIQILMEYLNQQSQQDSLESEVLSLLETLYEFEKGNPQVDAMYAGYLFNEERYAEAEPVFDRLLTNNPNDFGSWQNMLFALNAMQKFEKMDTVAQKALEVFPNQALFYLFLGIGKLESGLTADAVSAFRQGLRIPGTNPELNKQMNVSLAEALYKNGEVDQAFSYFDDILSLDPDDVLILNNYSYYLSLLGRDLDKALTMIEKCMTLEKDNPTYLDTYAWVLFKLGRFDDALRQIERVMELDADPSPEVLDHYGDILWATGNQDKAMQVWEKIILSDPSQTEVEQKVRQRKK